MNRTLVVSLMFSAGLLAAATARAEGTDPCAIDAKVGKDGAVELSNIGHTSKCDVAPAPHGAAPTAASAPAVPPAPVAATSAGTSPVATDTAKADPAVAPPAESATPPAADAKDPRSNYRDAMIAGAPGTTGANPAVSRRYKMMDKATYQATVLGGTPPAQDSGATAPQ